MASVIVSIIGTGVSGILAINNTLMARKGSSSARSVGVVFQNMTDRPIYLKSCNVSHGVWTQSAGVPGVIEPGMMAGWMSESQGFMTGTEGNANFSLDSPNNPAQVFVSWNNPYAGSNSYSCSVQSQPLKITRDGGDGDNASVVYHLQKA